MRSPARTMSPALTSHLASVPFSIVGDSAGILTSMVMSVSQEKFGCRLDDGVGIQPVGAIKIGTVAGLADAIGPERAHPHAPDPAKPDRKSTRLNSNH